MKEYIIFFCLFLPSIGNSIYFSHTVNSYATHQPILYELVLATTGPIIEFGCGDGSTDLLHEMCKKTERILISVDDNYEWFEKFTQKYSNDGYKADNSGWHKFYFVSGKKHRYSSAHWITFLEECPLLQDIFFDICFVDQSPWGARFETIKRLKQKSRYTIIHDCDYFPEKGIFGSVIQSINKRERIPGVYDFSDIFPYFKVYFPLNPWPGKTGPPTLVGSMIESKFPNIDYTKY